MPSIDRLGRRDLRCLIFDAGKVLVDFSVDKACYQLALIGDSTPEKIKSFLFDDGLELLFEAGGITAAELLDRFNSTFGVEVSRSELALASSDIFQPISATFELLKDLKANFHGPMIVLSNTNELHWEFVSSRWPIHQYFDHCVLSFEVKALKPSAKIYQFAVETSGQRAEHCFFTDDLAENVLAAKNIGMDAVQFSSAEQIRKHLELRGIRV